MPIRRTLYGPLLVALVLWSVILWNPERMEAQPAEELQARDLVKRGTVEVGVAAGFWQTFDPGDVPSANRSSVFILPRVGLVVSNEWEAGLLSGNIEVLVEPMFGRYVQSGADQSAGGALVVKYNFLSFGRWMPFWDLGVGMLWTNLSHGIADQRTHVNAIWETGPGVHYFLDRAVTLTAGVRFHHISNASIGDRTRSLNAVLPYVGISYFFSP